MYINAAIFLFKIITQNTIVSDQYVINNFMQFDIITFIQINLQVYYK